MDQQILVNEHEKLLEPVVSVADATTNPGLIPIDRVLRQANRVSIAELFLAFLHCSVLLPLTSYLGIWTAVFGFILVSGIYHSHLRKHVRAFLGGRPIGWYEKICWPWFFAFKLVLTGLASFFFFLIACLSVISLFYLGLRFGYSHSLASELAGWWGFFPSMVIGSVAGTFGMVWIGRKTLALY